MSENLKSTPVTNLDASPVVVSTAGEGAPGVPKILTDSVLVTSSVAQWSTYRLARFSTNAKVKRVRAYTAGIDTNATATAILDFNVAFSDSLVDGTPSGLQATIPSSNHDGTSLPFVAGTGYNGTYINSGTGNKIFGRVNVKNSGVAQEVELTFNGSYAPAQRDDDLWDVFGFVSGQSLAQDPGGFFDIFVVVSAAVATAAAGVIGVELDYVV